jgi:hypothetical protein
MIEPEAEGGMKGTALKRQTHSEIFLEFPFEEPPEWSGNAAHG